MKSNINKFVKQNCKKDNKLNSLFDLVELKLIKNIIKKEGAKNNQLFLVSKQKESQVLIK